MLESASLLPPDISHKPHHIMNLYQKKSAKASGRREQNMDQISWKHNDRLEINYRRACGNQRRKRKRLLRAPVRLMGSEIGWTEIPETCSKGYASQNAWTGIRSGHGFEHTNRSVSRWAKVIGPFPDDRSAQRCLAPDSRWFLVRTGMKNSPPPAFTTKRAADGKHRQQASKGTLYRNLAVMVSVYPSAAQSAVRASASVSAWFPGAGRLVISHAACPSLGPTPCLCDRLPDCNPP